MLDQPPPTYNISEAAGTVPASHSPGLSKMDKISLILFVCGFAVLLVWLFSWLLYIRLKRRYEDRQKQAQMEAARRSPTGSLRLYPRRWELSAAQRGLQRHAMAVNNGNANGRGLRQAEHPNLRGNSWQMDTLRPIAEEPEEQLPKYQAQEPNLPTYMEVYVNPRWGWPQSTPAQRAT
jgi:hypothetical protein